MKTSTLKVWAMIAASMVSGNLSAKDLYISADGNDSNSGIEESQPRATLTSLNDIIAEGDVIHVKGMIDMTKEIPLGDGVQDKNSTWGHYISYNNGNHNGFYINGSNTTIDGKLTPWKQITITGEDPAEDGFDGKDAMRIFYVRGDNNKTTVTFKNLTLRNGLAPKEGAGAIFIHDNGWVEVENCIFEENHLDYTPLTETEHSSGNTQLKSSNSERGGAIYAQTGRLTVTDSKFYNNHNRRGGALIVTGGTVKVTRCEFEGNGADIDGKYLDDSRGGAVHLWPLNTEIAATFDHCNFIGNTTWNSSGALFLQSNTDGSSLLDAVFTNCSFIQNRTVDGQGGAVVVNNGDNYGAKDDKLKNIYATFANCSFLFNESKSEGGAMFMTGGIQNDELRLVNCTMAKNSTKGNAGHGAGYSEGIANDTYKPEVTDRYFFNCLFEQNEAPAASSNKGEYSDLLTYSYFSTSHSYYGRMMFTKLTEQDFWDGLAANGYSQDNVWHGEHNGNFGDESHVFVLSDDAINGYDWSGGSFKFMTLGAEDELLTKGNPDYLTLEARKVSAPNGKEYTLQGYDISESDQMGFERPQGTCAVGAMEVSTDDVADYYDGRDFPYLSEDGTGSTATVAVITDINSAISYKDGIVTAESANVAVYNISGVKVATGYNTLSLKNLPGGVYIVNAIGANGSTSIKVVL